MQENKQFLVVGLGNPGSEYERTRHNVGFMAVDNFAGHGAVWKKEKNALTTRCVLEGHKVILVKPQTFMNNSGISVAALLNFYKIPLENLIVIHDDMDVTVGNCRKKLGGGSAGHNGIKSIDAHVGREYLRVRIGIGHPRDMGLPINPSDWVLGIFTTEQYTALENVIKSLTIF